VAESLGADFLIDRSQEADWSKAVFRLSGKRGVDVVVDNVGTTYPLSFRAARKGGRILTVGNTGGPKFEIDNRYILANTCPYWGSTMGTMADFSKVMEMVFAGHFKPVIDRSFPLAEAAAAHERMEKGEHTGKITLAIG
jgi:NADPH:quinone reductase-like Zn-dependent oxidoreductase